jgi:hypothetical protein
MNKKYDDQNKTADHTSRLLEDDRSIEKSQQNTSLIDDEMNG